MSIEEVIEKPMAPEMEQLAADLAPAAQSKTVRPSDLGDQAFLQLLGTNLREEMDYRPEVIGNIPAALRGTLYRNGPGLFERDGYTKKNLLDGDGLMRAWHFGDDGIRFNTRFVRTPKFIEEEEAGHYRYSTWATRTPGGPLRNLGGGRMVSQAGITVYDINGQLMAFDEVGAPYAIDPESLETGDVVRLGPNNGDDLLADKFAIKAHTKVLSSNGDWVCLGQSYGPTMKLHVVVTGSDGALKHYRAYEAPRLSYIHDYAVSGRYAIAVLHPATMTPLTFLSGMESFVDSFRWRPETGNVVMVMDLAGEEPVRYLDAPASWVWHFLNAYDHGNSLVVDFVGYDEPDHFIGNEPIFATIMEGRNGNQTSPGTVRRYEIDLARNVLRDQIIDSGNHEFPVIDPAKTGIQHQFGYFAKGEDGTFFHDGLSRIDYKSGAVETFHFGDGHYVEEPIFVPEAGGDGWVLAPVLERSTEKTSLGIWNAGHLADGPVAQVKLKHHLPISFHGTWV